MSLATIDRLMHFYVIFLTVSAGIYGMVGVAEASLAMGVPTYGLGLAETLLAVGLVWAFAGYVLGTIERKMAL